MKETFESAALRGEQSERDERRWAALVDRERRLTSCLRTLVAYLPKPEDTEDSQLRAVLSEAAELTARREYAVAVSGCGSAFRYTGADPFRATQLRTLAGAIKSAQEWSRRPGGAGAIGGDAIVVHVQTEAVVWPEGSSATPPRPLYRCGHAMAGPYTEPLRAHLAKQDCRECRDGGRT